ncbi:4-hydroxyproline epimerase [Aliiroseovarius sediminilitoris]|uniref:4-hydroxyproline epimerase n=1 Tax=Aliiroseovarius sediminilitoris TaxID=1173584 RepID=A0A1I0MWK8_9RHOB|nr:proline racemase family protein [Aliiroseovarius sediminilitoris]SEV92670.1 4-hydroxyproline epimerase [Aliiroseovarius sediminilitoris]
MRVIDSHTEGEPTRVILSGGPDLGTGSLTERARRLRDDHGWVYAATLAEPRGHDAMVGALLVPPSDPTCVAAVIYFNTVGNLGMCGHATIGLTATLAHLGQLDPGTHRIETPVGVVSAQLFDRNTVRVTNVESYRLQAGVTVDVDGIGPVTGDIAWGGNWFFLTEFDQIDLSPDNIPDLTQAARRIRAALQHARMTGKDGAEIDHIELLGPPKSATAQGRNFVLCPGGAYDRSPCGTGCSAKLACLAADGKLAEGAVWKQESVIGSTYDCTYVTRPSGGIVATIQGRAFITSEATLLFNADDPFRGGIRINHRGC